ncbi:MAG TPA: phosphoglucosamine mutase [Kiritimatiellia bacterium]|nr:phosphoglucosamine mutase [Kiritimatiellia bacterium]HRZ13286.1 phosphoglucosamine mutase [Kiritimatiellia bacterium]HSA18735.1 phosphoglucosamine mutase [Kiritimatiellia bacterium]
MARLFGTDGVRGVANVYPMTAEMALELGRAAAYVCKRHKKIGPHRIVIGKDTRVSGYMLETALTAGITSMGVDVLLVGPMPTPGIAFITQSMRADAGMVISASHNPFQDNGIKIFSRDGFKLPDAEEDEIERLITSGEIKDIRSTAHDIGKAHRIDDAVGRYIVFCKNTVPEDVSLDGLKVVLDCANGATYRVAPIIFWELGAEVTAIHCEPDGTNINANCGSQHTQDLSAKVRELKADVGLAFDGDGDRLIAVDENGQEITGDHILTICAKMLKESGRLTNNLVISTVMSNFGFGLALKELGIQHGAAKVGDRYVLEMMQQKGAVLGGEASGHIILLEHHTTGDGILSALQLLVAMRHQNRKLSELATLMQMFPQKTINVDVAKKPPLEGLADLQAAIKAAEAELGEKGRVLIRYSGTQSMCRVMVEGPNDEIVNRLAKGLADQVKKSIG